MNNYISRAELEELSEGLISVFVKDNKKITERIDIEKFITEFLKLRIEYVNFAEEDKNKMGFLADGSAPLLIYQDGKFIPFVFPKDTIVVDSYLLAERENGRRRFTIAHEAAHHILNKVQSNQYKACFHTEYDKEKTYTKEELVQMFTSAEWQTDTMAASLLMPRFLIENAISKYAKTKPIKIFGGNTFAPKEKAAVGKIVDCLGVSFTALVIRLRGLDLLEYHSINEYISKELGFGKG